MVGGLFLNSNSRGIGLGHYFVGGSTRAAAGRRGGGCGEPSLVAAPNTWKLNPVQSEFRYKSISSSMSFTHGVRSFHRGVCVAVVIPQIAPLYRQIAMIGRAKLDRND